MYATPDILHKALNHRHTLSLFNTFLNGDFDSNKHRPILPLWIVNSFPSTEERAIHIKTLILPYNHFLPSLILNTCIKWTALIISRNYKLARMTWWRSLPQTVTSSRNHGTFHHNDLFIPIQTISFSLRCDIVEIALGTWTNVICSDFDIEWFWFSILYRNSGSL